MVQAFKSGVFKFSDEPNFNYQLNRTVVWSGGDPDALLGVSNKIKSTESEVGKLARLDENSLLRYKK
jgi:hypothetical protein